MQNVADHQPDYSAQDIGSGAWVIPLEWVAYAVLIALSLVLRLSLLGQVPMTAGEVPSALTAWAVVSPFAPFSAESLPASPIVFQAQKLAFTLLGHGELPARVLTALAGVVLGVLPFLFRGQIGATRALMMSVLLTFSPVMLVASRFSSGTVWALVFALVGLFALWQSALVAEKWRGSGGVLAMVSFALMALFSSAGGLVLALILAGAGLVAVVSSAVDATQEDDPQSVIVGARARLAQLPYRDGVGLSVLVIAVLGSTFLTHPEGLSSVGALVGQFVAGVTQPPPVFAYPLLVTLFYEPLLAVFALVGLYMRVRDRTEAFADRFMLAWLALALLFAFVYGGARPDHALLLTVPLVWFASYALARLFYQDRAQVLWAGAFSHNDPDAGHLYTVPWGKWLTAVAVFAMALMLVVHLQMLARQITLVENGSLVAFLERLGQIRLPMVSNSLLWTFITVLFLIMGFFLSAAIWERVTALQGYGLGFVGFMLVAGVSAGWHGAVQNATNPVELWHLNATTQNYPLLRRTLIDFAQRETQGEPKVAVAVVRDPFTGLTRDGIVAWALRDFTHAEFVEDLTGARLAPLVIAPTTSLDPFGVEEPDLGGGYVGQSFVLQRLWSAGTMQGFDFVPWMTQRRTRFLAVPSQEVILWARQDVYHHERTGN